MFYLYFSLYVYVYIQEAIDIMDGITTANDVPTTLDEMDDSNIKPTICLS